MTTDCRQSAISRAWLSSGWYGDVEEEGRGPGQTLSRAEAAAMVFRMMGIPTIGTQAIGPLGVEPVADTFIDDDILWDGAAEPYIEGLVQAGAVNGCNADSRLFCPLRLMSRGEAITVLFRAFRLNVPTDDTNPFVDVDGVYYEEPVRAGAGAGLLDQSVAVFRGEHPITRGEFAIWLAKAAGLEVCRDNPFTEGRQAALSIEFPGQRFSAYAWDAETGCTYSLNSDSRQPTASVFKVMVMAGALLEAQTGNRALTAGELAWLRPMISVSANDPVRSLWRHFGSAPGSTIRPTILDSTKPQSLETTKQFGDEPPRQPGTRSTYSARFCLGSLGPSEQAVVRAPGN